MNVKNLRLKRREIGRGKKTKIELLGYRLKKARIDAELSQAEVAAQIGIPQSAISFYENGSHEPSLSVISDMANIYGVNVDYLISGD